MENRVLALILTLTLASPIRTSVISMAQSSGLEAQKNDGARVKEIIQKLRDRKRLTGEELDFLERVLSQVEQSRHVAPPERGNVETGASSISSAVCPLQSQPHLPSDGSPHGTKDGATPAEHPLQLPSGLSQTEDGSVYIYVVDLDKSTLRAFWLDQELQPYESVARLAAEQKREGYRLTFAINGGIYDEQRQPKGLYIEQGKIIRELDTTQPGSNYGNFYLEPNGVFVIDSKSNARILITQCFSQQFPPKTRDDIQLAVQSGPALLINGAINSQFAELSSNKKMRSGVGLINERRIVFAMSSRPTNLCDCAALFAKVGCRDALYLDGDVGAMYVEDRVSIRLGPPLVTILAVSDKMHSQ